MKNSKFGAHGDYDVYRKGTVVFVRAQGAMNSQAAEEVFKAVMDIKNGCPSESWAIVVDTTLFELGTPGFQEKARDAIQTFVDNGLRKSAHIVGKGMMKQYQIANTMPDNPVYMRQYFENEKKAVAWLAKEGYSTEE